MPKWSGMKIADLTPREARVIPLAIQWDQIKECEDAAALKSHIEACYQAECPDMARRVERKLKEVQNIR